MATKLNFTKQGSRYICDITPTVPVTVQVEMEDKKDFTVYSFIGDMTPVVVYSTNILDNLIFQVDVPEGVTVRMVATSPVKSALMV